MKQSILFLILSAGISLAHAEARKIQLSGKDVAADEDEQTAVELQIRSVDLQIKVHGTLASTRIEFTIHNPSVDVEAQADFILPLPPNSTVTGYALDIDGDMVDGVYVEKEKARNTYDDIVSQKIDPGLLEARDDNTFSINIFPVPEKGQRVFSVEFITDLSMQSYELPLNYKGKVKEVSLSMDITGLKKPPRIGYPQGMYSPVERKENGVYIDNEWKNIDLKGSFNIRNEERDRNPVIVGQSKAGDYYFLLDDSVDQPAAAPGAAPDHITLFWDASISRQDTDTAAELKLLEKLLKRINAKNLMVDTVIFRDQVGKSTGHKLADDPGPLLEQLQAVPYDGASNLAAALQTPLHGNNDDCLLFTDGEINYGSPDVGAPSCRMYVIFSGAKTNPYLEDLALRSGGDYFSLTTEKADIIVNGIGAQPLRLLSVTVGEGAEIYTDSFKPLNNRLRISGRLASAETSITLNYGTGDTVTHSRTFELKKSMAVKSETARLLWARSKIGALLRAAHPDRESIIAVSQQHGILSPYTSLLVLEDVDQYVTYRIEPPATNKRWVKEYLSEIEDLEEEQAEHFDGVVKQWTELVEWWKTDFHALRKKKAAKRGAHDADSTDEEIVVTGLRASMEDNPNSANISVNPWSPDRVYLTELNNMEPAQYFDKYIEMRKVYGGLPAYYIEVADFLKNKSQQPLALQVLSNLIELEISDYTTWRILGYKLLEYGELDLAIRIFESVLEENSSEPQSFRDLGLALIERADSALEKSSDNKTADAARQDYLRGIDLLYNVVLKEWDDRFEGIALVALMEINRAIAKCKALGVKDFKVDTRLIRLLDVDMRVVAAWHADQADIDLWVIEPTGESANYGNQLTEIGGRVSNDMTAGFGPEEYLLKKAPKGKYTVKVHYYGADGVMPTGAVKLLVDVYTNYARTGEKRAVLTIELADEEDKYLVGEIEF
jgi:Ca-activated chloride channel family protein